MELNDIQIQRRESLSKLRELGINPYPADVYAKDFSSTEIAEQFDNEPAKFENISFASFRRSLGPPKSTKYSDISLL